MNVHPLLFEPIYKPKIWGGDSIFTHFGRAKPSPEAIGESWELADLENDQSRVRLGPARGRTLGDLRADWGVNLLGHAGLFQGRFPLLIKFLDARSSLSVQVHPTEAVARHLGGHVRVKHEAWYILAAEPRAAIYHGLEPGINAATFREAMRTGRVDGVLHRIDANPGQCHYLPSGTPHALGAGVLVAEIQTPSDVTYRAYDWGRIDPATGQPRDLHLDQAIASIDFDHKEPRVRRVESRRRRTSARAVSGRPHRPPIAGSPSSSLLVGCESFVIRQTLLAQGDQLSVPGSQCIVWVVLKGAGVIRWPAGLAPIAFGPGDVVLQPAALADAMVEIASDTTWLEVTVPSRKTN